MRMIFALIMVSASSMASAGEFRAAAGLGIGSAKFDADTGDELKADVDTKQIGATFFLGDSGPFFGVSHAKSEVDDVEVNDVPVTLEGDADSTAFSIGYRGGVKGRPQFFGAATIDDDAKSFEFGFESEGPSGRYSLTTSYSIADDDGVDVLSFQIGGTKFLSGNFGVVALAGLEIGDGHFLGYDVDTSGWVIGAGVEFRFGTSHAYPSPAPAPVAPLASSGGQYAPPPPPVPDADANLASLIASCGQTLSSSGVPASCSTNSAGGQFNMAVTFSTSADARTWGPTAQDRLLQDFCSSAQKANLRGIFSLVVGPSRLASNYDCQAKSWTAWNSF